MEQHCFNDAKLYSSSAPSSSCPDSSQSSLTCSNRNVFHLLARREISPGGRKSSKKLWGDTAKWGAEVDARHALVSWVEAESLRNLSAKYCPLLPPPRSTIAAAFSLDGKTLASTHGDHTVKIIDCQNGKSLKVLRGHRRTPWVVRFHPLRPEILASGSLDHEVRLWDAHTAVCISSHNFYRPIASIAFHAQGELLAVASGHKLFIWNYNGRGESSSPSIVLKTQRSLRAVHFHPHAAPLLLTAEVNDLDSPDSPLTLATSSGYLHYPPPAVFFVSINSNLRAHLEANMTLVSSPYLFWPTFVRDDGGSSVQLGGRITRLENGQQSSLLRQRQTGANVESQFVTSMDISPVENSVTNPLEEEAFTSMIAELDTTPSDSSETNHGLHNHSLQFNRTASSQFNLPCSSGRSDLQTLLRNVESGQIQQFIPISDPTRWERSFVQGWLMGQSHASLAPLLPMNTGLQGNLPIALETGPDFWTSELLYTRNMEALLSASTMVTRLGQSRGSGRSGSSRHRSRSRTVASRGGPGEVAFLNNVHGDGSEPHPAPTRVESDIPTSLAAAAAAELPCTVKLRIWPHDIRDPCSPLHADKCRLIIPQAVLCSEMGTHFSPCGRFLVACVACMLPNTEGDTGLQSHMQQDATGAGASPTRHPISAHQVMYELRIYSLEEATFGMVLASKAIRAAHCLTSIQFSPTSEHILLAYGRRHSSLLRSIVIDGEIAIPIYTILEVYRVSDMELVRVLPSAEDEVNVACFHPLVGGGIVYGTKEGRLRILQFDGLLDSNCTGPNFSLEESMLEE